MSQINQKPLHAQLIGHVLFKQFEFSLDTSFYVALSGGVDSVVLLHLLYTLKQSHPELDITALHFNHAIHSEATNWERFCGLLCGSLKIAFYSNRDKTQIEGVNLEAAAREARYQWFQEEIKRHQLDSKHAVLLTAHHVDDLAETLLLYLSKGRAMSSFHCMPESRLLAPDSSVTLARPLLQATRLQIERYAAEHDLDYVQDPSNADIRYDRNFLRKSVIPVLQSRFTNWSMNMTHSIYENRARNEWQAQYLRQLRAQFECPLSKSIFCLVAPLKAEILSLYNQQFCVDMINDWLYCRQLTAPTKHALHDFLNQIVQQQTGYAQLDGDGFTIAYYNHMLYLLNQSAIKHLTKISQQLECFDINPHSDFELVPLRMTFHRQSAGIDSKFINAHWQLCWRKGGEKFQLKGQANKSLKQLFQEYRIPKWQRDILPLLYVDNKLAWVHGIGVGEPFLSQNKGLLPQIHMLE